MSITPIAPVGDVGIVIVMTCPLTPVGVYTPDNPVALVPPLNVAAFTHKNIGVVVVTL